MRALGIAPRPGESGLPCRRVLDWLCRPSPKGPHWLHADRVGCAEAEADVDPFWRSLVSSEDYIDFDEEEEIRRALALSMQDTTTNECGANCAVNRHPTSPPKGGSKKSRGGNSSRSSKKPRKNPAEDVPTRTYARSMPCDPRYRARYSLCTHGDKYAVCVARVPRRSCGLWAPSWSMVGRTGVGDLLYLLTPHTAIRIVPTSLPTLKTALACEHSCPPCTSPFRRCHAPCTQAATVH